MSKAKGEGIGFSKSTPSKSRSTKPKKSAVDHSINEREALALIDQGKLDEAETIYRELIDLQVCSYSIYINLAAICGMQRKFDELIALLQKALELKPNQPEVHNNLGIGFQEKGDIKTAIASYQAALKLRPSYPEAHNNLGTALEKNGKIKAAIASYNSALQFNPIYPQAYNNLGNALEKLGDLNAAIASYRSAIKHNPNYPEAHYNLGNSLKKNGDLNSAIASYDAAIKLRPSYQKALNNLGSTLKEKGNLNAAFKAYNEALKLRPNDPEIHNNIGTVLKELGDLDAAIASYRTSLKLKPHDPDSYFNLGNAHQKKGDLEAAVANYQKAYELDPDNNKIVSRYIYIKKRIASWDNMPKTERFGEKYLSNTNEAFAPLIYIGHYEDPIMHYKNAILFAKNFSINNSGLNPYTKKSERPKKIDESIKLKVGYFSSNFRVHPVLHLLKGVLRNHDISKFDIYLFDTISKRPQNDPYLQAIESSALNYIYIGRNSLDENLRIVKGYDLDVAIDLMGYTDDAKVSKLFSKRIAPAQINYLGYPGTTGSKNLHDYIIADKIVIPKSHEKCYEERVIHLPNCYLCSDNTNIIASTRDLDMPEDPQIEKAAFVFCCFNSTWKITSKEFDVWMRLLGNIKGSVLWLRSDINIVIQNLRFQAQKRNIDPDRLVFAEKIDMEKHLARLQKADLFLDTFAYNAHATALDALWAGLPLLTMQGNTFPSRVGASILSAVGLFELITTSVRDYETKAEWLANHPNKIQQLREKLMNNRLGFPLFDTEKTTRDLEQIYKICWEEANEIRS